MYTYTPHTVENIQFRWSEGAYIEVFNFPRSEPFDVINVWDYAKDTPRIPLTLEAFRDECEKYLEDLDF